MNAALLRCPICGGTCQTLMRSLATGLPHCNPAGHHAPVAANDNEPGVEFTAEQLAAAYDAEANRQPATAEIVCHLGWTAGCPYRSCERAGECQAPQRSSPFPDRGLP